MENDTKQPPEVTAQLPAEELEQAVAKVLDVPLHRFVGLQLVDQQPGTAHARLTAVPNTLNNVGVVHGGIYYALLDAAAYLAVIPLLRSGENAVTHDIHVSVMRPVAAGETLDLHGTVTRRGRSLIFAESEARVAGKLIATARVTKSVVVQNVAG